MTDTLEIMGGICRSISFRTAAIADLTRKLADQTKLDEMLKKHLLEIAPASWKSFLEAANPIDDLLMNGNSIRRFRFGDYSSLGWSAFGDEMRRLELAWAGIVALKATSTRSTYDQRDTWVELSFSAIPAPVPIRRGFI